MGSATEFLSSLARLGFKRESTYGTPQSLASNPRWLGITPDGVPALDKQVDQQVINSTGFGRRPYIILPGRRDRTASINVLPTSGEYFYYLMGTETFSSASPNIHTLSVDNTFAAGTPTGTTTSSLPRMPSMTLGYALPQTSSFNFSRRFSGVCMNGARISMNETKYIQCETDFVAQRVLDAELDNPTMFTQPTTDSSVYAKPVPYMFYDRGANMSIATTYDYVNNRLSTSASAYGGNSTDRQIARLRNFTLNFQGNLQGIWVSQSRQASGNATVAACTATINTNTVTTSSGVGSLNAGDTIILGADTHLYRIKSIATGSPNTITLNTNAFQTQSSVALTQVNTPSQTSTDPQDVYGYFAGRPEFSATVDIVPAGKTAGDTDALYDLLESEIIADAYIPLQRPVGNTSDRLDFVISQMAISRSEHPITEDGGVITVTVDSSCAEFRIVARDSIAAYNGL